MKLSLSFTAVAFTFLGSAAAAPHGLAKKAGKSDGFTILAGGDMGWKNWQPLDKRYCTLFNTGIQPINDCDPGDLADHVIATEEQEWTAKMMATVAQNVKPEFLINTGDNFYDSGLKLNDTPSINRFYSAFVDMYNHSSLQIPWYMTLGNHDVLGDVTFQTELANKLDSRWIMNNSYYSHEYKKNGVDALFIHYDTDCFLSTYQQASSVYSVEYVKRCGQTKQEQVTFITEQLSGSAHDYKFVIAHHPILSATANYSTDLAAVNSLVQEHKAIYVNGHDHCMGLYQENNIPYILTGALSLTQPGDCNYGVNLGPYMIKAFASPNTTDGHAPGGFVSMDFTKAELVVHYWLRDGHDLSEATKKPAYSVTIPAALNKKWW